MAEHLVNDVDEPPDLVEGVVEGHCGHAHHLPAQVADDALFRVLFHTKRLRLIIFSIRPSLCPS